MASLTNKGIIVALYHLMQGLPELPVIPMVTGAAFDKEDEDCYAIGDFDGCEVTEFYRGKKVRSFQG